MNITVMRIVKMVLIVIVMVNGVVEGEKQVTLE